MKQDVLKQAAEYSQEHRRRRRRHRVLSALAMVMVFCTVYTLIMPALTLEGRGAPLCGIEEHVHTDECYGGMELTCGLEEVSEEEAANGHVHTDECYELAPAQPCELPEGEGHTHTDECYEMQTVTVGHELICELEEGEDHTHTDECYTPTEEREEKVLICGQDEYEPHTHTAECLEPEAEKVLICELEEVGAAHVHTEECYTPILICGKIEHTHTEDCWVEEFENEDTPTGEDPYTELERTVDSMGYRAVFHAVYFGELAEEDELELTAVTTEASEMESDRDYEYAAAIGERTTLPGGRTEFALMLNGEPVDRALYEVMVEIIPSRYMVAGLYQTAASTLETLDLPDTMDLADEDYENEPAVDVAEPVESAEPVVDEAEPVVDETEPVVDETEPVESAEPVIDEAEPEPVVDETEAEPEEHTHSHTFVGFMAYELEEGELAIRGSMEVDLSALEDMDAYMAEAFDEENNPVYDETYAFNIQPLEQDFMFAAGVEEDPIEEMVLTQKAWDDRLTVYWDGLTDNNSNTGTHPGGNDNTTDHHVTVTMTHSDKNGVKDSKREPVTITHGQGLTGSGWSYNNRNTYGGINLKSSGIYPNATTSNVDYAVLDITPDTGYYVKQVIIACAQNSKPNYGSTSSPYGCSIWSNRQGVFQKIFDVSEGTHVSLTVSSEEGFGHASDNKGTTNAVVYGILIQTAPIPSPLFVQYDPGKIGDGNLTTTNTVFTGDDTANWLTDIGESGGRLTKTGESNMYHEKRVDEIYMSGNEKWLENDLLYTVAGISEDAAKVAREAGYEFAGWQLDYYNEAWNTTEVEVPGQEHYEMQFVGSGNGNYEKCTSHWTDFGHGLGGCEQFNGIWYSSTRNGQGDYKKVWVAGGSTTTTQTAKVEDVLPSGFGDVELRDRYSGTYGDVNAFTELDLITNAKLTAIWVPLPQITVTKQVTNWTGGMYDRNTFTFQITDGNDKPVSGFTKIETTMNDAGNIRQEETKISGSTFTLDVRGNGSASYRIAGLPAGVYKVTETDDADATSTIYKVNGGEPSTSTTTFTVQTKSDGHTVVVVNDYTPIVTYNITIEKVTPDTSYVPPETSEGEEEIPDADIPQSATAPDSKWSALSGAEFDLYAQQKDESGNVMKDEDGNPVWIQFNEEGPIVPTTDGGSKTAAAEKSGLSLDTLYKLVETEAPAGYNKLAEPIYFMAKSENPEQIILCDANGKEISANANASANALTLVVANYGGFVLPSTGGTGTYVYALGGALLMAAAVILMYMSRKRAGGYAA